MWDVRTLERSDRGLVEAAITRLSDESRYLRFALLAELTHRARDEGHSVRRAHVLAVNNRSLAMLRSAGFRGRHGAGVLREYELELCGHKTPVICSGRDNAGGRRGYAGGHA